MEPSLFPFRESSLKRTVLVTVQPGQGGRSPRSAPSDTYFGREFFAALVSPRYPEASCSKVSASHLETRYACADLVAPIGVAIEQGLDELSVDFVHRVSQLILVEQVLNVTPRIFFFLKNRVLR